MAITTATPHTSLLDAVAAPFRAVGTFLILLAESGPRVRALEALNAKSDEELAARGTTRGAEVQRILGVI